jgi:hypothetical protein
VIDEFTRAAEDGHARNRSGRRYRPSALRDLTGILRHHVARSIGATPIDKVRRRHVQGLIDRLAQDGLSESRIRSVVSALRALFGYAIERGYLEVSPANGLVIPRGQEPAWRWSEADAPAEPGEDRRPPGPPSDLRPLALLPERILSFVLRIAVVLFILIALASITESL